jgi:hypothetical protein
MNARKRLAYAGLLSLAVGSAACADAATDDVVGGNDDLRTGGMALTASAEGTDVDGFQFSVEAVDCDTGVSLGDAPIVADKGLEDLYLPGGISVFEQKPYDGESEHYFSDHYFLLDAGCWDVTAQPLSAGAPSAVCQPAHKPKVSVEDGLTAEILLISQCEGAERGGLDVIGSLNRPPEVTSVEFRPSKFLSSCQPTQEEPNEVCVTAMDPDGDPIEFSWSSINEEDGPGYLGAIRPAGPQFTNPDGSVTMCGTLTTGPIGDYGFNATVFDTAWKDGLPVRIEQLLEEQEGFAIESRDSIDFPVYAQVDCQGRSSVILMAMKNEANGTRIDLGDALNKPFIRQAARWVSPKTIALPSSVLHVLDDNGQNEQNTDTSYVITELQNEFGAANVTSIAEPALGLTAADVAGYDVIWFSNPGFPMDDASSYMRLMDHLDFGGGLVIQGDDMAGPAIAGPSGSLPMEAFSYLGYQDNGVSTCGLTTNGNTGANYRVTFTMEPISILDGLRGQSGTYGNDIDHVGSTPLNLGVRILANASLTNGSCSYDAPAAVAIDPADLL